MEVFKHDEFGILRKDGLHVFYCICQIVEKYVFGYVVTISSVYLCQNCHF